MKSSLPVTLLLSAVVPNQATSSYRSYPSSPYSANEAAQQQTHSSYSHKPATSILAVKSLHQPPASNAGTKDDFARLNKRNKYEGPITRDTVHEAVVWTKRQRPSQDIVVMGVASWN